MDKENQRGGNHEKKSAPGGDAVQERLAQQGQEAAKDCLIALSETLTLAEFLRLPITASTAQKANAAKVDWLPVVVRVRNSAALISAEQVREGMMRGVEALGIYGRPLPGWTAGATRVATDMHGLAAAWLRNDEAEQKRLLAEIDQHATNAINLLLTWAEPKPDASSN